MTRNYENYLIQRRNGNTFLWASREVHPQVAFKQEGPNPTPEGHKRAVLNSLTIQEIIEKISSMKNIPKSKLERQVIEILDEIGYKRNFKVIRWLGYVLTKICLKVCDGMYINKDKITEIRPLMGNCPVIFVPSHRSYIDFVLMSYVCFAYELAIPTIVAGMDFHGMVGMGTMLRNTGAFFMRRSYNDDSLYWSTFKQYVFQLVTKNDLPIEFFIEGTRSRSNKSLPPKYGLLSMILKAYFLAQVPDILFVPINISYDRIFEENLFAYELLGVPKPKESTSAFFKSLKILKESFGNLYMHFDAPISAREFFNGKLDRSKHNFGPIHNQEILEDERRLIPHLAEEIVFKQQKSCVLTTFNLIAIILNDNLVNRKEQLTFNELLNEVGYLKNVFNKLNAHVHVDNDSMEYSIMQAFKVHWKLIEIKDEKINLIENKVIQDKIDHKKLKAHSLSDKTMSYSVPFVTLQIYVNPALHYVISEGLIVQILSNGCSCKDELLQKYTFLRSLYMMEFVLFPTRLTADFENALGNLLDLNVIVTTRYDDYQLGDNEKIRRLLKTNLEPFFVSYLVTIVVLERLPSVSDEKTILSNVQAVLENILQENDQFVHPYCLNLDTLNNCLNSLGTMRILIKNRRENKNVYEIDKGKLFEIKNNFEQYVKMNIDLSLIPTNAGYHQLQNKL